MKRFPILNIAVCLQLVALGHLVRADDSWAFLDNGIVRIGVKRTSGAGIGWFSESGSQRNFINDWDRGRLVQQSYYGQKDDSLWDKQPWRYNPVQGGDWRGNGARVLELRVITNSIYAKTLPKHWASGADLPEVTMEEWITLTGKVAHVRFKMTYTGTNSHPVCSQEVPAFFVEPDLDTLVLYDGAKPWTGDLLNQTKPSWPNESRKITEHWAAYVDKNDFGVGGFVPVASELTCYRFGDGKREHGSCSYFAPLVKFPLTPGKVFEYDLYITIGNSSEIRDTFREIGSASRVASELNIDRIDRHALVTRHNVEWNDVTGKMPLGNGEFCFTADGTGLQTFGGNSMAHWAWHSFPLPAGRTMADIPSTGTFAKGRIQGPDEFPPDKDDLRQWMFDNPHIMNLGRLRLCRAGGSELKQNEVSELKRTLDLWSGKQTCSYQIDGQPVQVETCVDPALDGVALRIKSPLLAKGEVLVALEFPYPALRNRSSVGDFSKIDGHKTVTTLRGKLRNDFLRVVDGTTYHTSLAWSFGGNLVAVTNGSPHTFLLSAPGRSELEFLLVSSPGEISGSLPGVEKSFRRAASHWKDFWSTGGAIDLSGSKDARWFELERRIVLSQYLMAAQSAGSWPSSESGLMEIDPWRGQFHMEMVWWHLAHYALWDRWPMAEKALGCYERFTPAARALAEQLDYRGLKWGKSVGPEGRTAPWNGNQALLWKQPHPIFVAELDYRLHPNRATLERWRNIVFGTAEHMADYPTRNPTNGICSLAPVVPPSEQGFTRDAVFDLAYWRWGLDQAQQWRQRLGLPREPHWDEVRSHLAPLPVSDGVFVHSAEWLDTYTKRAFEHPDPVGVFGMLPPIEGVSRDTAHRTLLKVWQTWEWNKCWGWDFPWMAMAAARNGEPQIAIEALLKDCKPNRYDQRGLSDGWYLPGNGGLLYAAAMMAAGWDGCATNHAPGFPQNGNWSVKWEKLRAAP